MQLLLPKNTSLPKKILLLLKKYRKVLMRLFHFCNHYVEIKLMQFSTVVSFNPEEEITQVWKWFIVPTSHCHCLKFEQTLDWKLSTTHFQLPNPLTTNTRLGIFEVTNKLQQNFWDLLRPYSQKNSKRLRSVFFETHPQSFFAFAFLKNFIYRHTWDGSKTILMAL